jgi:hypothetical protein
MLTKRELATVLASLRHWQQSQSPQPVTDLVHAWPHFAEHDPLSPVAIDALCHRLNESSGRDQAG